MIRALRLLASVALIATLASACGGAEAATCDPNDRLTLRMPPTLGGLTVAEEPKLAQKLMQEGGTKSYACDASVFSLRDGKELRAVFQVVRLAVDARPEDVDFRKTIVNGIGGTSRKPAKVGNQLVYTARQNLQIFLVWFLEDTRFMNVLIVREDETVKGQPAGVDANALLAQAVALEPVRIPPEG